MGRKVVVLLIEVTTFDTGGPGLAPAVAVGIGGAFAKDAGLVTVLRAAVIIRGDGICAEVIDVLREAVTAEAPVGGPRAFSFVFARCVVVEGFFGLTNSAPTALLEDRA
jgi:hypothetical protein